jgi:DNA-binding transcriptional regulator GbsR (MarR family)
MIEAAGHATQSLGLGKVPGQIYAYLYMSREARSLNEITEALGVSKGSVSMCVRQLEQWTALEKIWVRGDRKDYYRARDSFGKIIKNALADLAGRRLASSGRLLDEVEKELGAGNGGMKRDVPQTQFIRDRVRHLREFQNKARGMWESAILQMLLR